jgi:peptidoglycan/LPS O-acetylase OafA/YrhL
MSTEKKLGGRIEYLDGMRGIAILLVVLFHAFARWPLFVPYGTAFSELILAKYGWLGVELFFMISGFVIYMTLEKCSSFSQFIQGRWLRLFPAMLIVTAIDYFSADLLPERPAGSPILTDTLPGLLFIEPLWIAKVFHIKQGVLEGAFWSLFVEVKFYVLFGGLYFLFGSRFAKAALMTAFFGSIIATVAAKYLGTTIVFARYVDSLLNGYMSFNYSGWFLIGVLTFDLYRRRSAGRLVLTFSLGGLVAAYTAINLSNGYTGLFGFALVLLFVGSIYSDKVRRVLSTKCLLFIGFISYPFYLFHENFMIAVIIKIGQSFPQIPAVLLPLFPFLIVCLVAFVIAKYLEPPMRQTLNRFINFIKDRIIKRPNPNI